MRASLFGFIALVFIVNCSYAQPSGVLDISTFNSFPESAPNYAFNVGEVNPLIFNTNQSTLASAAQTFTAGLSGKLASVGMMAYQNASNPDAPPNAPLWVTISATKGGNPLEKTSDYLGSLMVNWADTYGVYDYVSRTSYGSVSNVDFSSLNISIKAGETYAIILSSQATIPTTGVFANCCSSPYSWWGKGNSSFNNGNTYISWRNNLSNSYGWVANPAGQQMLFETYVAAVPEPSAIRMLFAGLTLLLAASYRRSIIG